MEYIIGFVCGVGACLALRAILLEWMPEPREEPAKRSTPQAPPKEWAQTRNFLYYDGTVMPLIKEESNEQ